MNNDLIDMLEGMLSISRVSQTNTDVNKFIKWKKCVALSALGWKAVESKKEGNSYITITWKKEGREDLQISLSFTEQCLWLDYMEKKDKSNVNAI